MESLFSFKCLNTCTLLNFKLIKRTFLALKNSQKIRKKKRISKQSELSNIQMEEILLNFEMMARFCPYMSNANKMIEIVKKMIEETKFSRE